MQNMKEDDILLIAGKGHETYQEIAGKKIPFDDVQVVVNEYKKIQQKDTSRSFTMMIFTDRDRQKGVRVLSKYRASKVQSQQIQEPFKKVCGLSPWLAIDLMHTIFLDKLGKRMCRGYCPVCTRGLGQRICRSFRYIDCTPESCKDLLEIVLQVQWSVLQEVLEKQQLVK